MTQKPRGRSWGSSRHRSVHRQGPLSSSPCRCRVASHGMHSVTGSTVSSRRGRGRPRSRIGALVQAPVLRVSDQGQSMWRTRLQYQMRQIPDRKGSRVPCGQRGRTRPYHDQRGARTASRRLGRQRQYDATIDPVECDQPHAGSVLGKGRRRFRRQIHRILAGLYQLSDTGGDMRSILLERHPEPRARHGDHLDSHLPPGDLIVY